jgi:hypothetical protein
VCDDAGGWPVSFARQYRWEEFMRAGLDRITTTIKREWLAQIIAGDKKIEYRDIKPY